MFTRPQRNGPTLPPDAGGAGFAHEDVLCTSEWSALAPGCGGWTRAWRRFARARGSGIALAAGTAAADSFARYGAVRGR